MAEPKLDDRIRLLKRDLRVKGKPLNGLEVECTKEDLEDMKEFGFSPSFGGNFMGVKLIEKK